MKENTSDVYEEEVLTYGGDYDYVLGQISDFEYSYHQAPPLAGFFVSMSGDRSLR